MECCVCLTVYSVTVKPFVGRCGHSICEGCVSNLRDQSCPTCRAGQAFENPAENYLAKELLQHIAAARNGQPSAADRPARQEDLTLTNRLDDFDSQDLCEALAIAISENASLQRQIDDISNQAAMQDDATNILQEQVLALTESLYNQEMVNKELREERDMAQARLESRQHIQDCAIRRTTETQEWDSSTSEDDEDSSNEEDEDDSDDSSQSSTGHRSPPRQHRNNEDCSCM